MSAITIQPLAVPPPNNRPFEVVERKGLGHPDTLCDMMAERASLLYSRHCLASFGKVPHHWFDKVMLVGGEAELKVGSGRLLRPYRVIFAGKAARSVGRHAIPLGDILSQAARSVLSEHLIGIRPERDVEVEVLVHGGQGPGQPRSRYRPRAIDEIDDPGTSHPVSNDCNVCVGFAPLTPVERVVLLTERHLQSPGARAERPFLGCDIKLVGTRVGRRISLLANVPFLADRVTSFPDYLGKCDELTEAIRLWVRDNLGVAVDVAVNPERRWGRAYLTVTGTVADTGDVGVTGRGNRANGLITPMRPMSIEASAGKNPLDHTGKLYAVLASRLAEVIAEATSRDTAVTVVTAKGAPLNEPDHVCVEVDAPSASLGALSDVTRGHVQEALERVSEITGDLLQGRVTLW
jgi:S-adenosylmethionine synthetase